MPHIEKSHGAMSRDLGGQFLDEESVQQKLHPKFLPHLHSVVERHLAAILLQYSQTMDYSVISMFVGDSVFKKMWFYETTIPNANPYTNPRNIF